MKLKCLWKIITTPSCWVLNHPYSDAWDKLLNEMLDNPTFTEFGGCSATLNGVRIGVANFPYSSGRMYYTDSGRVAKFCPSRSTVFRLEEMLDSIRNDEINSMVENLK